jgi:hypothetical protein
VDLLTFGGYIEPMMPCVSSNPQGLVLPVVNAMPRMGIRRLLTHQASTSCMIAGGDTGWKPRVRP